MVYDTTGPTVTVEQAPGQADPTGLTPANFTVVFSKPVAGFGSSNVAITGTAAGTKTATITEIAPNDATTYNVAISGMTSSGTVIVNIPSSVVVDLVGNPNFASTSTDNSVTFNFVKPGVPALTAPINGTKVSGLQPLLDWNASSPVAQYYQIQVAKSNTFAPASLVIDQTNLTDSQLTPSSSLIPGLTYYWHVRGFNSIGMVSNWSAMFSFKTPLDTPVLNSPSGLLNTDRPSFDWNAVPGATSYVLQVSKVNTFSSLVLSASTLTSPFTPVSDLLSNQPLFWRVQAKTATVVSDWSTFQAFTTGNPPSVPVLTAPGSNALVADFTPLFNWGDATVTAGVTFKYYEIQVDDEPGFANPLALTGTTTPTLIKESQYTDNLTLLNPKGTYYWRVRSVGTFNSADQYSAWSSVRTFRTVLATPVLVTPADLSPLTTRRPPLDWQDVDGATKYQIAISRNANMAGPILSATLGAVSTFTPIADLPANTLLYWHVRAMSTTYGTSSWSETWSFTTGNPPSVPALLLPANNALMNTYQPSFDWSTSIIPVSVPAGALKHYEIQFAKNKEFSLGVFSRTTGNDPVADSDYQLQGADVLDPNTTYYWRVRAVSTIDLADHTSSWSAIRTIRTPLAPPTSLTVIPNLTVPGKPTFDWDNVLGATGYTIQISKNADFSSPLVNASTSGPSASSYVPAINLPLNTPLYWRVLAKGTNTGLWANSTHTIIP